MMMNLIILFVVLLLIAVISYYSNRNIFMPSFLTATIFSAISLLSVFLYNTINKDISLFTVLIVFGATFFMLLGELLAKRISISIVDFQKSEKSKVEYSSINISNLKIIIAFSICFLTFILRMKTMFSFSNIYGIDNSIASLRLYVTHGEITNSMLTVLLTYTSKVIAYLFTTYFFINLYYTKKATIKYIFPIIGYLLVEYSTTGRNGFLKYIVFFLFSSIIISKMISHSKTISIKGKYIKLVTIAVLVIGIVFFAYGRFAREISDSIFQTLGSYVAGGIYGLDYYIHNPWDKNTQIFQYTFYNIYDLIQRLGIDVIVREHNLPFYTNGGITSNIYTGFVLPIQDFGFIGFFLTRLIIGFSYAKIWKMLYMYSFNINKYIVQITIGISIWYPIWQVFVADRFIDYIDTNIIINILLFVVIDYFMRKAKNVYIVFRSRTK